MTDNDKPKPAQAVKTNGTVLHIAKMLFERIAEEVAEDFGGHMITNAGDLELAREFGANITVAVSVAHGTFNGGDGGSDPMIERVGGLDISPKVFRDESWEK